MGEHSEFKGATEARLTGLEDKHTRSEFRIDNLEASHRELIRFATILENMQVDGKKRDKIMEKQSITLDNINKSQLQMANKLEIVDGQVGSLKKDLGNLKEDFNNFDNVSKISIPEILKSSLSKMLIVGIIGTVIFLLGLYY